MRPELEQFYELVEELQVAMMTTRRADGHLKSRAMATHKRAAGADLWFVAAEGAGKLTDIVADPHVNLAYYKDRTREWGLGVRTGDTATRSRQDPRALRARLEHLVRRGGGSAPRHDGRPRLVLIGVDIHAASFLEVRSPNRLCSTSWRRGSSRATRMSSGRHSPSSDRRCGSSRSSALRVSS